MGRVRRALAASVWAAASGRPGHGPLSLGPLQGGPLPLHLLELGSGFPGTGPLHWGGGTHSDRDRGGVSWVPGVLLGPGPPGPEPPLCSRLCRVAGWPQLGLQGPVAN